MKRRLPLGMLAGMSGMLNGLLPSGPFSIYMRPCLQIPRDDGPEMRALRDKFEVSRKAAEAEAIQKAAEKRARRAARKKAES